MASNTVEKIKEKIDIAEIIGSYIKLEKAGQNLKAKCPFHNEKTPSFFVSPNRQSFYCFGCGAKGDIFTFVEQFESLDFMGAMRILAGKAGVEIEQKNEKVNKERERIFEAMEEAAQFFEKEISISGTDAVKYLKNRKVKEATIEEWRIGYAPDEWRALRTHLSRKKFTDSEMLKAGLIKPAIESKGEKYYDTFRGRVMFPIFDQSGRVIAFSGRILKDLPDTAKYLNSPETDLFKKSETIYGLHKAKGPIRKQNYSILVEGQMDLIMAHQAGFENTVASSGTALTPFHLERLKKISPRIILAFDGDGAGIAAADRGAAMALGLGMEVKLAALPSGTDPADLIKNNLTLWKNALIKSKHIIDFHLDKLLENEKDARNLGKKLKDKVLPYVASLQSSIEKSNFVSKIAKLTGIKEEALWDDLKKSKPAEYSKSLTKRDAEDNDRSDRLESIKNRLFGIIYWQRNEVEKWINIDNLEIEIKKVCGEDSFNKFLEATASMKDELIFKAEEYYKNRGVLEDEIKELILNLEEELTKRELEKIRGEIKESGEKDSAKLNDSLKRSQLLSKRVSEIAKKRSEM